MITLLNKKCGYVPYIVSSGVELLDHGYPNISDFIIQNCPKNIAKYFLFTVGYPNLKFLTSSLIVRMFAF